MIREISELATLRDEAVKEHRSWKRRILTLDSIAADEWQTVWDDLTVEYGEPLVENIALQALEDKAAAAASVRPRVRVAPTRGTAKDRAEKVAAKRRRVFKSYWDRSFMETMPLRLALDWMGTGTFYLMPWCDFYHKDGSLREPSERFPFQIRVDPRQAYPLGHNLQGRLTEILFTRMRRFTDIQNEYGYTHPALMRLRERFDRVAHSNQKLNMVEETWWYDEDDWAVAVTARVENTGFDAWRYVAPTTGDRNRIDEWLVAPTSHQLNWCPVTEGKRTANDGEYRGAIDAIIPRLKVAQNIMARYLEDVADSVHGPVVMENIINPEDYGPNAELIGDGQGRAKVEYPRKPIGFEARQSVLDQLDMGRRDGKYPVQRGGDPNASVLSERGTTALMGAFNDELRSCHTDIARALQWNNVLCANYDEVHAFGRKTIDGFEGVAAFEESYDAATLFRGDYRNQVSYGFAAGLDRQNLMSLMALGRNLKGISQRTFMRETGLVDDEIQEERDILIEDMTLAMEGYLMQQAAAGNLQPLQTMIDKVDDDSKTVRQAVSETITEMQAVNTQPGPGQGQPAGALSGADPERMVNSLEAGGAGTEGGVSDLGARLRRVMPAGMAPERK